MDAPSYTCIYKMHSLSLANLSMIIIFLGGKNKIYLQYSLQFLCVSFFVRLRDGGTVSVSHV